MTAAAAPSHLAAGEILDRLQAMHRRAQRAEALADSLRSVVNGWMMKSAVATAWESRLSTLVVDLAESLAEAGVEPLAGSDNPHEDTLGLAVNLVPAARLAVDRIRAQRAPDIHDDRTACDVEPGREYPR